MGTFQTKRFQKNYHRWTDKIESCSFKKTPAELKNMITDKAFEVFVKMPFVRAEAEGKLLINEDFVKWNMIVDFTMLLDYLPDDALKAVCLSYRKKYGEISILDVASDDENECAEKLIFVLAQEIIQIKNINFK